MDIPFLPVNFSGTEELVVEPLAFIAHMVIP